MSTDIENQVRQNFAEAPTPTGLALDAEAVTSGFSRAHRRHRARQVILGGVASLAILGTATWAGGWLPNDEPRALPASDLRPHDEHEAAVLAEIASDVIEEFHGQHGYAGTHVDFEKGEVFVYWKGEQSAGLDAFVTAQSARTGVSILIEPAAFSDLEMEAAKQDVAAASIELGADFLTVRGLPDGSGLEVTVPADSSLAGLGPDELTEELNSGVPITSVVLGPPTPESDDIIRFQGPS